MSVNVKAPTVDRLQVAEVLARGFQLPYRVFDFSNPRQRFVLTARGPQWTWIFLVNQATTRTTYDCFLCDDTGVMHTQLLGVDGAGAVANFDFMTELVTPFLATCDDSSPAWDTYTRIQAELLGERDAATVYASTSTRCLERTANTNNTNVSIFFSSENTNVDNKRYKILLMRVTDNTGRDDLVTAVFNTEDAPVDRPAFAPSLLSPLFRSAVRLYTTRAYPQMLDVLQGPDAAEWMHKYECVPYPTDGTGYCWTRPKLQAKTKDTPVVYDNRFDPFKFYRVVAQGRNEQGKRYLDLLTADGETVRRPAHHFILIPGKHENVRID